MKVSEPVPSTAGSAWNSARLMTGELRFVVLQFLGRGTNEEAAGKQAVPGVGRDDADRQPVARVGAGVEVLHVQVAALRERAGAGEERLEPSFVKGLVVRTPPHFALVAGVLYDPLVIGRAPGVRGRDGDQRAVAAQFGLAASHGVLVEPARGKIPVDGAGVREAEVVEALVGCHGGGLAPVCGV